MSLASHIQSLPDDLVLLVLTDSLVDDILSFRHTCKRFYRLSKVRWLWITTLKQQIIDKGLRVPAADPECLRSLTSHDIETRAVHAARFHENWISGRPKAKRSQKFSTRDSLGPYEHDSFVRFLTSRKGELVVSVINGRVITCWEVPLGLRTEPLKVAQWEEERETRFVCDLVVNDDPSSPALFAVAMRTGFTSIDILVFSLDKFHGNLAVLDLKHVDEPSTLHALRGNHVLYGDLKTYDWRKPDMVHHFSPPIALDDSDILVASFVLGFFIVVRYQSIQAIRDPYKSKTVAYNQLEEAAATVLHGFEPSEAVIVPHSLEGTTENSMPEKPITILFRCTDDGYDSIRQYDLLPMSRSVADDKKSPSGGPAPFPFRFPLACTRIVPVMPSCSQLRFCPSGKGIWLETRNVSSGIANEVRAARCVIGADISSDDDEEESQNMNIRKGEVYSRRCGIHEVVVKQYNVNSVDLEDSVGRIIIGDREGNIEVLEYA